MRNLFPFTIDVKPQEEHRLGWRFYHMRTNQRIATSSDVHLMNDLSPSQIRILVEIVMLDWTAI